MARRIDDVMRLCCEVAKIKQMKAAVVNAGKGGAMAGGTAFLGGLFGGPLWILIGGLLGSLLGYWMTSGQFKPLPQIIMELPPRQKQKLYSEVMVIVKKLDWMDAAGLIMLVTGNAAIQQKVAAAILSYFTNELKAEVRCGD